jgi:hypothetical protein
MRSHANECRARGCAGPTGLGRVAPVSLISRRHRVLLRGGPGNPIPRTHHAVAAGLAAAHYTPTSGTPLPIRAQPDNTQIRHHGGCAHD